MIAVQFLVDAGNSNEKKALLQMLEAGVTYIADRGYYSFPLLAAIATAQAFFVFRAKINLVHTPVEWLSVNLPSTVQHLFHQVSDQRIRLTNAAGRPIYRLVSFSVGQERYLILTNRLDLTTFQASARAQPSGHSVVRLPLASGVDIQILETLAEWPASAQPFQRGRHDSLPCLVDCRLAGTATQAAVRGPL
jgi:hypothetical protein